MGGHSHNFAELLIVQFSGSRTQGDQGLSGTPIDIYARAMTLTNEGKWPCPWPLIWPTRCEGLALQSIYQCGWACCLAILASSMSRFLMAFSSPFLAVVVHEAKGGQCCGMVLLRGQQVPVQGLRIVTLHTFAIAIHKTHLELRIGVSP